SPVPGGGFVTYVTWIGRAGSAVRGRRQTNPGYSVIPPSTNSVEPTT
ncbi:MAG: hypothetical protein QOF04_846, partial [Solirubrobacteraceae bacterium]|nr:hypothetical protein [Solirubrobacteraceae bacterium]